MQFSEESQIVGDLAVLEVLSDLGMLCGMRSCGWFMIMVVRLFAFAGVSLERSCQISKPLCAGVSRERSSDRYATPSQTAVRGLMKAVWQVIMTRCSFRLCPVNGQPLGPEAQPNG